MPIISFGIYSVSVAEYYDSSPNALRQQIESDHVALSKSQEAVVAGRPVTRSGSSAQPSYIQSQGMQYKYSNPQVTPTSIGLQQSQGQVMDFDESAYSMAGHLQPQQYDESYALHSQFANKPGLLWHSQAGMNAALPRDMVSTSGKLHLW